MLYRLRKKLAKFLFISGIYSKEWNSKFLEFKFLPLSIIPRIKDVNSEVLFFVCGILNEETFIPPAEVSAWVGWQFADTTT